MIESYDKSINLDILKSLKLPPISQMGFVVQSLEESTQFYGALLNIKKWYKAKITECQYNYQGKAIDICLDIAVGYTGKTQIELIKTSGQDDNIYCDVPGNGSFGFHHFGIIVNNLEKQVSLMEKSGIKPLQVGTLKYGGGGFTMVAYLDTMQSCGFILELIETKAFGINFGMPQWLINLGRITGDTAVMKRDKD